MTDVMLMIYVVGFAATLAVAGWSLAVEGPLHDWDGESLSAGGALAVVVLAAALWPVAALVLLAAAWELR